MSLRGTKLQATYSDQEFIHLFGNWFIKLLLNYKSVSVQAHIFLCSSKNSQSTVLYIKNIVTNGPKESFIKYPFKQFIQNNTC